MVICSEAQEGERNYTTQSRFKFRLMHFCGGGGGVAAWNLDSVK